MLIASWVEIGAGVVGAGIAGVIVVAVADVETATDKGCTGEDNTRQGELPSKCPYSPFPWICYMMENTHLII